LSLIRYQYKFN